MGEPATGWPREATIHRIHDRYLTEVVEGLGLCPFARRSRELGRVHRPVFRCRASQVDPRHVADVLGQTVRRRPDLEIVLLTFIIGPDHPWHSADTFETFSRAVRAAHDGRDDPRFYMVAFHPELGRSTQPPIGENTTTVDNLVLVIRRTPDPVIQCVRADVLDDARQQASVATQARRSASLTTLDPTLRALIEHSIQADPELSAEIAQRNFDAVGHGRGLAELEDRIRDIFADRNRAYAEDAAATHEPP